MASAFRNYLDSAFGGLRKKYLVTFFDEVRLSQARQFHIRPLTGILLGILLLFSVSLGTWLIIYHTPFIRKAIPNCNDPSYEVKYAALLSTIDTLNRKIEVQDSFIVSYQRWLGVQAQTGKGQASGGNEKLSIPSQWSKPSRPPNEIPQEVAAEVAAENNAADAEDPVVQPASVRVTTPTINQKLLNLYPPLDNGKVRKTFDEKHFGLDFVAGKNSLVRASTSGTVIFSEYSQANGHVIGIAGENDIVTFYKHNSRNLKQVGAHVFAGEAVAVIGNSGENSTGPHLHYELWHKGLPIDPTPYFAFN